MKLKDIFELNEIGKRYERKIVLSSLSIVIKKGEIIALIGPSGAGKTTLLNILANIVKPDKGSLKIDQRPSLEYKKGKQLAKKVGIIRQQFDLVPQLPVIHNVLAGRFSDWGLFKSLLSLIFPQEKEQVHKALERVGLSDKMYEKTSNLSGGEQQRVAMARLLLQKPEAILADEPVSSLDPARAEDVLSMLTSLAKEENQTLVTVLHSVEYARKYFDRIIGMREGKIHFDLPSKEVTGQMLSELYNLQGGVELNE